MSKIIKSTQVFLSAIALAALTACGGGGGSDKKAMEQEANPPAPNTYGVAAVGHAIVGARVGVKCSNGFTTNATTSTTGTWEAEIPAVAYPCAIRVSGGTANGVALTTPLHSVVQAAGNVNITPLTELVLASIIGQDPDAWFVSASNGQVAGAITNANITTALNTVTQVLASLPGNVTIPNGFNPLTSAFTADQVSAGDVLLENYATGLAATGMTREAATQSVASGQTTLTQEVQTLTAFTPNVAHTTMVPTTAGFTKANDGTLTLAVADAVRGNKSAVVTGTDSDGNITGLSGNVFNGVVSFLGNKVGQICVEGNDDYDFDDGRRSQYAYVSSDMVEVTDLSEVNDVVFTQYDGCANRGITFKYLGNDEYELSFLNNNPLSPAYGQTTTQVINGVYEVEDGSTYTTQKKVYKTTVGGEVRYVFIYSLPQSTVVGVSVPAVR